MDFEKYNRDESPYQGNGEKVIFVQNPEDVISAMKTGERLTCQGSRTGLEGAGVPAEGGVLSFEKWTGLLSDDDEENGRRMTFASGTTLEEIRQMIRRKAPGFFWKPDPTEEQATIGGLYATNAKGPSCYGYGSTADHLSRIVLVTPSGEEITLTEQEEIRSLAGTEGSLFAVTECTLTLDPIPDVQCCLILYFDKESKALSFQDQLICNPAIQSLVGMDYIDSDSIKLYKKYCDEMESPSPVGEIPEIDPCVVYLMLDGEEEVFSELEDILEYLDDYAIPEEWMMAATEENEIRRFQSFRHGIQESLNHRIRCAEKGYDVCGQEHNAFPWNLDLKVENHTAGSLITFIRGEIGHRVPTAICSHYGSGEACLTFLPKTEAERLQLQVILMELVDHMKQSDVKFAGGFGIGKLRKNVRTVLNPQYIEWKQQYDPEEKMNPGNGL